MKDLEESRLKDLEESRLKDLEESRLKNLEESRLKDLEESRLKDLEESRLKFLKILYIYFLSSNLNTLEYGQYYHIYNRGINSCKIFRNEKDYNHFLSLYSKYVDLIGETIAYCLIPNHFHILVKIKEENEIGFIDSSKKPSEKEKWFVVNKSNDELIGENKFRQLIPYRQFSHLFNAYTKYFNKKYKRTGSLFEKNFHRIKLDSESYIRQLILYIHFNPVKHGISPDISNYTWSSFYFMERNICSDFQKQIIEDRFDGLENFILCHKGNVESFDNDNIIQDD